MSKKRGFTLAETLITVVILATVIGLSISPLLKTQKRQEYIAGYHRAVHVLNQAFSEYSQATAYKKYQSNKVVLYKKGDNPDIISDAEISAQTALDPGFIGEARLNSDETIISNLIKPHISLIRTGLADVRTPMAGCPDGASYFYTQDGMRYCIKYEEIGNSNNAYGEYYSYGQIWVDVNGDKGPNMVSTSINNIKDTFPIIILKNRFIPGYPIHEGNTSDTERFELAQKIYFNEQ